MYNIFTFSCFPLSLFPIPHRLWPSSSSATSYGTLNGTLPDLGYHWKVVVDAAVQFSTDYAKALVDFGSITTTDENTCSFSIALYTDGIWHFNTKFNGNSGSSTYGPTSYEGITETGLSDGDWVRRKITIGVRASETEGMDETYFEVEGLGNAVSAPFSPLQFNRWATTGTYFGRAVSVSSTYKYASNAKIYSIKVYKE